MCGVYRVVFKKNIKQTYRLFLHTAGAGRAHGNGCKIKIS